jgi:hypothetical protein
VKGNGDSDSNLTEDGDGNGDNSTCGSSYRVTLHLCDPDNKLALILGHPGKDECGHFIADGYDSIAVAAAALDRAGSAK